MIRRAIVVLMFSIVCCRRPTQTIPPHYHFGQDYELAPKSLTRETANNGTESLFISAGETTNGDPFDGKEVVGFVNEQHYGFWIEVTNRSGKSMRFLWPAARYADELGNPHAIYHYVIGMRPPSDVSTAGPPTELAAGATIRQVIAPGYKTYMIDESGEEHVFEEPLVPTTLKGRTPDQMKAYVDDLAKRQVPVKLVLPIEINAVRYDYTFTFVLKNRWSDLPK